MINYDKYYFMSENKIDNQIAYRLILMITIKIFEVPHSVTVLAIG